MLVEHGAQVNCRTRLGKTPLMRAASAGHVNAVKLLLAFGAEVDARTTNGNTALMRACFKGHVRVAQALISAGADIHATNVRGHSALVLATAAGRRDTAALLSNHGTDPYLYHGEISPSRDMTVRGWRSDGADLIPCCTAQQAHRSCPPVMAAVTKAH